jgi:putative tricarboxylic transport membrane protein
MDLLNNILLGFSVVTTPINFLFCFLGVLIGTLTGVLPGLGPSAAIALLLPSTYHLPPVTGIIMMAGIYYGAMYGGSTTSILVNIPGEAASVVTCLDGYQMALQGRAGAALGISAFASFIAGTLSVVGLMLVAPPLAHFALRFGSPEKFALMILAMTILTYLVSGSMLKALAMATLGIFLGTIGTDLITTVPRFTYGSYTLIDGLGLVPVVMGLFGISEVLLNLEQSVKGVITQKKISNLLPNLQDWKDSAKPIARGTLVGFFLGILPGAGAIISSFASYAIEKKFSNHPEKFGKGAIEGVAGPEAANNAATGGAFIPLLTLGIPANAVMAIILGGLLTQGIQPGPMLMYKFPDLFWGVVISMYIGNCMLLILNLPLIGIWVKILRVPDAYLFPLILLFCLIGAYTLNNNIIEVIIMVIFGVVGYFMKKLEYEPAPLVLAFVLSPMCENALRQSLLMSGGSFTIFFYRPISVVLLGLAFLVLISSFIPFFKGIPKGE